MTEEVRHIRNEYKILHSLPFVISHAVTNDLASVAQIHFRALLEVVQEKTLTPSLNNQPNYIQSHTIS